MRWLKNILLAFVAVVPLLFGGCARERSSQFQSTDTLYAPKYAIGFEIFSHGKSSVLRVKNPWQGASDVQMDIFLCDSSEAAPTDFNGIVLQKPLKKVICMSSSYVAFLNTLGCDDAVVGVSGAQFISTESVRQRCESGAIRDVGYDTNLNFELIATLNPDAVFIYGVAGQSNVATDKMRELNINAIYIGDYLEYSPLGKAEWIVALGEMFDCREKAQEIFSGVEQRYNDMADMASEVDFSPKVMLNAPWRDTWFVPGDRSYMVQLINDAGGSYVCAGVDSEQSRPISGESAYTLTSGADVWLNPNQATSIRDIVEMNPNFGDVPPVINGMVYNNNKRSMDGGGSDFWESGAVRPDIILEDMIKILHPELMDDHNLYYFKNLK